MGSPVLSQHRRLSRIFRRGSSHDGAGSKQGYEEVELVERLSAELERVIARMEPHFSRREAHEAASRYVKALLSPVERKSAWGLSEEAGQADPYSLQHMVRRAKWDEEAVLDDVQDYARQNLGEGGVLAPDETGFLKKGEKSYPFTRSRKHGRWASRLSKTLLIK
jgi:SRSO17 transposase